jgi:hypothetical protein
MRELILVLITVVLLLPLLASASPPDSSWIEGIYDGADFDDVVVRVASGAAVVPALVLVDRCAIAMFVGPAVQPRDTGRPLPTHSAVSPRAPPIFRRSPS